jgi:hypothetical protein
LFAALYRVGTFTFFSIMSPPIGAFAEDACSVLETAGVTLTHQGLSRHAHRLGLLWAWRERRARLPVHFTNTDGDPLLSIAATFAMADPAAVLAALRGRSDVDEHRTGEEFAWVGDGPQRIVLAQLELLGGELLATVNSEKRLERLRRFLASIPGLTELSVNRRKPGSGARPRDDELRSGGSESARLDLADVAATLRPRYMAWLDQSIPALGGKTPRQAVRTKDGRRTVTRLIRTYPDPHGPNGPMTGIVPRAEMFRELGLEAEGGA